MISWLGIGVANTTKMCSVANIYSGTLHVAHCPRVVSTRQVRNSQFFSNFGRLWPRQEFPCWPTNFKGGQFLSTNLTFVTWSYITKYFKMHHWIMPRPCLIMFLSKCDQDKNVHVACYVREVGPFCPLSPLLLRYHISLSVKKHPRIVLYLSWVMVLVKCDQDTNNWFDFNISWYLRTSAGFQEFISEPMCGVTNLLDITCNFRA